MHNVRVLDKYDEDPAIDAAVREYHQGLKVFKRDRMNGDVVHKTSFKVGDGLSMRLMFDKVTVLTGPRRAG